MGILKAIFGDYSTKEIKRIRPQVDRIEALRPQMQALTDEELRGKTDEFRKRFQDSRLWVLISRQT